MRARGKNGVEIVKYLQEMSLRIQGIKIADVDSTNRLEINVGYNDRNYNRKITFILAGKLEVSFDCDLEAVESLHEALRGKKIVCKIDFVDFYAIPFLAQYQHIKLGPDEAKHLNNLPLTTMLKQRSSGELWASPKPGDNTPVSPASYESSPQSPRK